MQNLAIMLLLLTTPNLHGMKKDTPQPVAEQVIQEEKNLELLSAINHGQPLEAIQEVVAQGADVNYQPESDTLPSLQSALFHGRFDVADFLVTHGARIPQYKTYFSADAGCWKHFSYMHSVLLTLHGTDEYKYQVIEWLLSHGADPDEEGTSGRTPLHDAAQYPQIALLLCRYGANPNALASNGLTPLLKIFDRLYFPATRDNLILIASLLEAGADVNYQHLITKKTALHLAAQLNATQIVAYLLGKGARKDLKNEEGKIPLEIVDNNPDLYAMLASNVLPPMPEKALQIENELQKLKHKIA